MILTLQFTAGISETSAFPIVELRISLLRLWGHDRGWSQILQGWFGSPDWSWFFLHANSSMIHYDTVDEPKSCMWLCILTTSIVAFSPFQLLQKFVHQQYDSKVLYLGVTKWMTQFVSFLFRTRWARGHLGGRPVFKTPEMRDAQIFLDYLTWTDGMSRFLTVGIQLYIFKHLTTFLRIIKLAIMVGTDLQVNRLCLRP